MTHKRRNFTAAVILARLEQSGFQCEATLADGARCSAKLERGRYHADHDIPDQMGGEPTIENCRVLCLLCHKAKTTIDVAAIAKAKRVEAKHQGIRKQVRPPTPIRSAPFSTTPKAARRAEAGRKTSLPPRMPRGFVPATSPRDRSPV